MRKIARKKNQIISVPTAQKTSSTKKTAKLKSKKPSLPTKTKSLSKSYKENTLAYYHCLIEQLANPVNEKAKITAMCHNCKHNKGEVAVAQEKHKQELVQRLAKDYKAFGQSLGHYLKADIIGCLGEKK